MTAASGHRHELEAFPSVEGLMLCSDITAFWRGPAEAFKAAIQTFHGAAIVSLHGKVKWYRTETMGGMRPVTSDVFDLLPFWLADPRARRRIATLELEGGNVPGHPSDRAFSVKMFHTGELVAGACRLVLPARFALATPDAFAALARQMVAAGNFDYAVAGLSVNWDPLSITAGAARRSFRYIAARYEGVDIPSMTGSVLALPDGIKCVNWMTFVGDTTWKRLMTEGEDLEMPADITVGFCEHGVLITAGQCPLLGDRYRGESMEAYRAVGVRLRAIRARSHPPILPSGPNDDADEATAAWLGRFDAVQE